MNLTATRSAVALARIRDTWRQIRRRWRARFRRNRTTIALLLLLLLSPGKTLLCIFHCQFWLPIMFPSYFAAPHTHHHHGNVALAPADQRPPAPTVAGFGLPLEGPSA